MQGRWLEKRRIWRRGTVAALAFAVAVLLAPPTSAQNIHSAHVIITQHDAVQAFDLGTGKGYQIGTASGLISGTTFVEFEFVPSGPPSGDAFPIAFHSKVILTDLDGDQLRFDNDGTGEFHFGIPGFPFQGSGGPLRGTYVLTSATGKYSGWKAGTKFFSRAIYTNPPSPPGGLGNVYVEVTYRDRE